MLGGPGRTGDDGVCYEVLMGWNGRDVSMAGMCACVKECVSFIT